MSAAPPAGDGGLRALAWASAALHVAGLAAALAWLRQGTLDASLAARRAYVAPRPAGWTVGWLIWSACALALVALLVVVARRRPSRTAGVAVLAAVGAALVDLSTQARWIVDLPRVAAAAGDAAPAAFAALSRDLAWRGNVGANGLYSVAVALFATTLTGPARPLGFSVAAAGAAMAAAELLALPSLLPVAVPLTVLLFAAWGLHVAYRPDAAGLRPARGAGGR